MAIFGELLRLHLCLLLPPLDPHGPSLNVAILLAVVRSSHPRASSPASTAQVVISNFRLRLSRQLTENARNFFSKAEEESERLGPLLQNLTNAYLGADFSQAGAVVGR